MVLTEIILKYTARGVIAISLFGAGCYVTDLKWEKDFADYQLSEKAKQDEAKRDWESRLSDAEVRLADSVISLGHSRDELEWMRSRVSELERRAKSSEAQWSARLAKVAVRQRELIERVKPALALCSGVLK